MSRTTTITAPDGGATSSEHGTRARYVRGCRCQDCRAAAAAYARRFRAGVRVGRRAPRRPIRHGTETGYTRGCRERCCRDAHARYHLMRRVMRRTAAR